MALQLNTTSDSLDQTPTSANSDAWTDQTARRTLFANETAPTTHPTPPPNLPKTAATTRIPPPPRPYDAAAEIDGVKELLL